VKKLYYEKRGRKYHPVYEYDSDLLDAFPKGSHLVMVYPGGSSRRYNIDPNYAAMIAAGRVAEDAVSEAINKALDLRPQKQPISEHQQKLWRELAESFKQDDYPLIRPATRDAAEAGVKAMMQEADKLLSDPIIKKAFDKFIMLCELMKNQEK
jgi:hypothetical protein